jgi:nicotinamide-nucleotide adenylyltransferase
MATSSNLPTMSSSPALRTKYASLLKQFTASTKDLEVLTSIPADRTTAAKTLYVLDSSFNPPTFAHLRIASTALLERLDPSSRLLLLLATQNADKPSKPAPFEDRLAMMELFAHDLRAHLAVTKASETSSEPTEAMEHIPAIDIGVTKKPYFVDKAAEIEACDSYPSPLEQVHLTGYDTLIRILNPKYYPPEYTLDPLTSLFSQHRLRVTLRPSDEWGTKDEQREFVESIARGDMENQGVRKEWAKRITLVEGRAPGAPSVSSTRAREAAQSALEDLDWLVPDNVRQFVLSEKPYSA